jgi:2-polyprenyl-3-methyl-5-hydroxy-6-metoxy-1,4-benzoquinol methylase
MNKEFWDTRYSEEHAVYGVEPNEYFKQQLQQLKSGKLFLPCEGEGRNAIYAAGLGWRVTAFDQSEVAKKKAMRNALLNRVSIQYDISDVSTYDYPSNYFDVVALIYTHQPAERRPLFHLKCMQSLKSGGTLILEGFSKQQLHFQSGGPKDVTMLYSIEEMLSDFSSLHINELIETKINLNEGPYHQGEASVIRLLAVKP